MTLLGMLLRRIKYILYIISYLFGFGFGFLFFFPFVCFFLCVCGVGPCLVSAGPQSLPEGRGEREREIDSGSLSCKGSFEEVAPIQY